MLTRGALRGGSCHAFLSSAGRRPASPVYRRGRSCAPGAARAALIAPRAPSAAPAPAIFPAARALTAALRPARPWAVSGEGHRAAAGSCGPRVEPPSGQPQLRSAALRSTTTASKAATPSSALCTPARPPTRRATPCFCAFFALRASAFSTTPLSTPGHARVIILAAALRAGLALFISFYRALARWCQPA